MGLNRLDGIRYLLEGDIFCKINQTVFRVFNLFVTSKNETTNSPIHEFEVCTRKRPESLLKPLFCGTYIIYYLLF